MSRRLQGRLNVTSVAIAACLGLAASTPALAQQAVQWRVEHGGNGHWYRVLAAAGTSYDHKASQATAIGGSLASISGLAENGFVTAAAQTASVTCRLVVGGRRNCVSCPWSWADGSSWDFTNWGPGEPGNGGAVHVELFIGFGPVGQWADVADSDGSCPAFVVEWSADCNGDGIVDYGQILDGTFADSNENGIPDPCEVDPCPSDIDQNGRTDGIDLAIILGRWGTNPKDYPRADTNQDSTVDATDLSVVLAGWGKCP
jgi:hypothetical protein